MPIPELLTEAPPEPPVDVALRCGEPQRHGGITIVPLLLAAAPVRAYITLDEAAVHGFHIEEVGAGGRVPELLVHNPLPHDVLLYDGEEVVGAKQNRVLEASVLVPAATTQTIPVACVEAGRWHDLGDGFRASDRVADPEVRRRKAADLERAPLARGSSQASVWEAVDERIHASAVESSTRALSDVHEFERPRVDAIADAFPAVPDQCGAILALGSDLCLDYVSRPEAWTALWPKVRRGYLLDGLRCLDDDPTAPELVAAFATAIAAAPATRQPSPGLGIDARLHGRDVSGAALVVDGETVQLSAYSRRQRDHVGIMLGERAVLRPSRRRR